MHSYICFFAGAVVAGVLVVVAVLVIALVVGGFIYRRYFRYILKLMHYT